MCPIGTEVTSLKCKQRKKCSKRFCAFFAPHVCGKNLQRHWWALVCIAFATSGRCSDFELHSILLEINDRTVHLFGNQNVVGFI